MDATHTNREPAMQTATASLTFADVDTTVADWDLLVACLHWNGKVRDLLTDRQSASIRKFADGFGPGVNQVTQADMFWDWSHVRDSSDAAIARMATEARRVVGMMQRALVPVEATVVVGWRHRDGLVTLVG